MQDVSEDPVDNAERIDHSSHRPDAPQEQAPLDRVLQRAPIGIFVLDRELRFLRVNAKAAWMFDIDEQERIGRRVEDALPETYAELRQHLSGVVAGGGPRVAVETSRPNSSAQNVAKTAIPRLYLAYYYPLESPAGDMIGVGCMFIDISEQRTAEGALRDSEHARHTILGQMLRAEETERSRLALELHDDTIQVLCALLLLFDGMIPIAKRAAQDEIETRLVGARALLSDATERARQVMFELHPNVLHERGLRAATVALADRISDEIGATQTIAMPADRYSWALEELAYRVVREALTNVRKHSRADNFSVTLAAENGCLTGTVEDDGCGFDGDMAGPGRDPLHLGVAAMTERAKLAAGTLQVVSSSGGGTRVEFSFPIG
jgi:signal transduction histidine kinase